MVCANLRCQFGISSSEPNREPVTQALKLEMRRAPGTGQNPGTRRPKILPIRSRFAKCSCGQALVQTCKHDRPAVTQLLELRLECVGNRHAPNRLS